jgi:hypothetical protein
MFVLAAAVCGATVAARWAERAADRGVGAFHRRGREKSDRAAEAGDAGALAASVAAALIGITAGALAAGLGGTGATAVGAAGVAVGAFLPGLNLDALAVLADAATRPLRVAALAVLVGIGLAGSLFLVTFLAVIAAEAAFLLRVRAGAGLVTADLAAGAAVQLVGPRERTNDTGATQGVVDALGVVRAALAATALLRLLVATG